MPHPRVVASSLLVALAAACGGSGGTTSTTTSSSSSSSASSSGAGGTGGTGGASTGGSGGTGGVPGPPRIYGVTVDDVTALPDIVAALKGLPVRATARIVFDRQMKPEDYADAVKQIHAVADVMGEILDSSDMSALTPAEVDARAADYVGKLGHDVDIWEIGNEINGDPWLGATADVVAKMNSMFAAAGGAGATTALTLYYNEGCYKQADHEMFTWAAANVPASMKSQLDYVLVSFYEDDCNGIQPNWDNVYEQLGEMFPKAKLGFGECGTQVEAKKALYVDRYYRMAVAHPRFVGGDFWWYFAEDMVPKTQPLWYTLAAAMTGK